MSDPITTFLSLAVPWSEDGYVAVIGPWLPKGATKPAMVGQAFKNLDAALRYINARRSHNDLYVCMSLQAHAKPDFNQHGKPRWKALRNSENALLLRSFWLDVDIKNGFFRDTKHAFEVFEEWRNRIGLPVPTLIVLTGSGGFHVHWVLTEPVIVAVWKIWAEALANAAKSFKPMPAEDGTERQLDLGLTTDAARLLRIPSTWNFKSNPPNPVELDHVGEMVTLAMMEAALTPHKGAYSPPKTITVTRPTLGKPAAAFAGMPTPPKLTAGLDDKWRPEIEQVAAKDVCPWIARVLHTGGVSCAEPEWWMSLQVAYFCKDGNDVAHWLSYQHPTYTAEETDQKFTLIEDNHRNGKLGWPQCATIHKQGAAECRICPHLSEGRSPLNFVPLAPAEPTAVPFKRKDEIVLQPEGYIQDDHGVVWKLGAKEDDPPKRISYLPILAVRTEAQRDDGSGRFAIAFDTYIDATRFKTVVLSYEETGDLRLFTKGLTRFGMMVIGTELLRRYLVSFTEQLRQRKITSANSEPYGWSKIDGKRSAFVYNARYNCAGITPIMPIDSSMAIEYQPMGTLECWKKNAMLITSQQRYDLIALMLTGIAAPLIDIIGVDGAIVHAYGESGVGKSHTIRVSQSTWARPVKSGQATVDTANAVEGKLGRLRNLPLFFDEIKGEDNMRKIVEIIFLATQGKTKARMAPTSDLKGVFEFCTMVVLASNNSLVDFINTHMPTSTAGLIRVFEIAVMPNKTGTGIIESTVAQRAMGELRENYGHPGVLVADYLGKNIENLETVVAATHDWYHRETKSTNDERFWIATMTAITIAGSIGNKLGLFEIDVKKLTEFLLSNFYRLRSVVGDAPSNLTKPQSVLGFIEQYINSHQRYMLVTDHVPKGTGRVSKDKIELTMNSPSQDYRDGVRIRYAFADKIVRFSDAHFRQWLKTVHRVGPHEIIEAAKSTLPVKFPRVILTAGTGLRGQASERTIELDLTQYPDLVKYEVNQ